MSSIWAKGCMLMIVCVEREGEKKKVEGESHGIYYYYIIIIVPSFHFNLLVHFHLLPESLSYLFHSCCPHTQVFGRTRVHEFLISYSHTEWCLFFSRCEMVLWYGNTFQEHSLSPTPRYGNNKNEIIIIIYHDFLPTPRRGSHVKSGKTHTQSSRYTP